MKFCVLFDAIAVYYVTFVAYFSYAGQTTPVVNHSDGSLSSVRSQRVEGTTEATLYNATTVSSLFANLNNIAVIRNKSDVMDNATQVLPRYIEICPSKVHCDKLGADCIDCEFNSTCRYGANVSAVCRVKPHIICLGDRDFTRWFRCRYCYQTHESVHRCTSSMGCQVAAAPLQTYEANCTVKDDILCLGRRQFLKMKRCNWTSGKRWSTALILSITLGGFGADRFYLGLWREGIGKLFSFGGLGVWTIVDVILVATGYIGPADGSLYIV